jgi:hypothetical protein
MDQQRRVVPRTTLGRVGRVQPVLIREDDKVEGQNSPLAK